MNKLLILLFLLISIVKADLLDDRIKNLIGDKNYIRHKNLINIIFKEKEKFYLGENLNHQLIVKELSSNGLLELEYNEPDGLKVEFLITGEPIKSLKLLNNTLKSLGYYYYFTDTLSTNEDNTTKWTIRMKSKYIIDPNILTTELRKEEIRIFDIFREDNSKWIYKIDTNFAKISQSIFIDKNEKIILKKPLKPYMLEIDGGTSIDIISRKLNDWYPYVVFYDKDLNVLSTDKRNKAYGKVTLNVPKGTKYIKISDLFTLNNIKRGLSVILKEL